MAQSFPPPSPTPNDCITHAITQTQGGMDDRILHDPITLFSSDYDAHNGNDLSTEQSDGNSSLSLKRNTPSFSVICLPVLCAVANASTC
mmetsp:Transcript_8485/g.14991  ORF Transcript_8485/g.14991 Transcript_8485/m.14991 type:complete len:89 (+) Transcript_8485:16-282(+)